MYRSTKYPALLFQPRFLRLLINNSWLFNDNKYLNRSSKISKGNITPLSFLSAKKKKKYGKWHKSMLHQNAPWLPKFAIRFGAKLDETFDVVT